MKKLFFLSMLLLIPNIASATPSVFVRNEKGYAWWTRKMEARILGQSAGSVTAKRLSDFLEETMVYYPYRVCSLEQIQHDTYVGIDRATQADINATLGDLNSRLMVTAPDGRQLIGTSVVFEGCDPDDPRGAALLITDAASGEILRWILTGNRADERGNEYPNWTLFMSKSEGDELFSYSRCTECGDQTNVYYDVTRKKIYLEHNGH